MESSDWHARLQEMYDSVLCQTPEIEFVVAFGSRTTEEAISSSDLDIAVKFADELSDHNRFRKQCFLAGELQDSTLPHIDIIDIEAVSLELAHDAVAGKFICGDRATFRRFRTNIETEFANESEQLREHQQNIINRIAEEGLRG